MAVLTVVNLAVYNEEYNGRKRMGSLKTYIHLPVDFETNVDDLKRFFG